MDDEIVWCDCYVSTEETGAPSHTVDEHSDCGGVHSYLGACGGCDTCMSAQIAYYRRLEREEV